MKSLLLVLSLVPAIAFSQAPPVGSISQPVGFATFTGNVPYDTGLPANDGKIVVLMYFTSW